VSTARRLHYTYEQYLRALEMSDVKLEYCDGVIYAMAGGTPAHAALAMAAGRLLGQSLLGQCMAYSSDLKIRIDAADLSTFPDCSVICGPVERAAIDKDAATNPSILVEVTSASTEDYDRGEKLSHYKQLTSLQAVLFVSHRSPCVTVVQRTDTGWVEREVLAGESVTLPRPALSFAVNDLYAGIALEA
jgi:Uma2 family endonuclease